jgi:adenylate cyclase
MTSEHMKRRLVAVLSADVQGYSRLMSIDEEATVRMLTAYKGVMENLIGQHGGRVVDAPGDNLLAEFASVVDAVQCAVEIQKEIQGRNEGVPEDRRMEFRIGVNLGDVLEEGEKIFGDGVNIVARVERLAEPGGVCISGTAYDQVKNRLPFGFKSLGEHVVKNISEPVRVYRVLMEPGVTKAGKGLRIEARGKKALVLGILALLLVVAAVAVWRFYVRPIPSPMEAASQQRMAFPLPGKPSIAVLPFSNISNDPDQEYFIDGMTDDLITDLSKISGVFVIARNSTFTYKGKDVKIKQVAEELGVRYVLEGSVRKAGEQVRINAQLIDATKGHHLWAERYDGKMQDIFALQDKITRKIVSALAVKLTSSEKELIAKKGTDNLVAYDAFLRGWGHYLRDTPDDFVKAEASLKKAVELDPSYGRAYAALSAVYSDASMSPPLLKGLGIGWHEARARMIQNLKKATECSIAHSVKSQRYLFRRQHQEALSEIERALVLDPNDPTSLYYMGKILTASGRPEEAAEFFKKGLRLDPHNPSRYLTGLGRAYFCMGDLEEAVGLYEKAMRLNPENAPWAWGACLAAFYALLGRDQEARAWFENYKKIKVQVEDPGVKVNLRYIMNGAPFKDRAIAERLAEGLRKAGFPPANIRGGYFPAFKENQLTGGEIKRLLFGSTINGYTIPPQQFWMTFQKDGKFTWRGPNWGPGSVSSDTGKIWMEGDAICRQFEKRLWGSEQCATVFRYPGGTPEGKDEYFFCNDFGFNTFSVVK